jgi:hypothetical protein
MAETEDEHRIDSSSVNHVVVVITFHIIFISSPALQVIGGLGTDKSSISKTALITLLNFGIVPYD